MKDKKPPKDEESGDINWRDLLTEEGDDDDDDDEELEITPTPVIEALGFDPKEFSEEEEPKE